MVSFRQQWGFLTHYYCLFNSKIRIQQQIVSTHVISLVSHLCLFSCALVSLCTSGQQQQKVCFSSSCSVTVLPVSKQQEFVTSLCKLCSLLPGAFESAHSAKLSWLTILSDIRQYDLSCAERTTHTWWVTQCFCLFNGNRLSFLNSGLLACCFLSCQYRIFSSYTKGKTYWIQLRFRWNTLRPCEVCDSLLIYLSDPFLSCVWKKKLRKYGGACALQISGMWG